MPELTFVTTCRNRLAHLKESLPTWVSQPNTACIVVDYGCPEESGTWVERTYPQVQVVRAGPQPRFVAGTARNLGAAAVQSPWICFIDGDIRLAPEFSASVVPLLKPGHYYQADPRTIETWGTAIVRRDDFQRIGGYDEVLQGWGKEDDDLYARLVLAGVSYATFSGELLNVISHGDELRIQMPDVPSRHVNESINHVYCRAKFDLMLLRRAALPLEQRQRLYEQVRTALLAAHQNGRPLQISVPFLAQDTRACGPLEGRLVYSLPQPQGDPAGPKRVAGSVIPRPGSEGG